MKKILFLSFLFAFVLTGCTTSNNTESTTIENQENLEESLSAMQEQIDALNDKLESATATTTTTEALKLQDSSASMGIETKPNITTTTLKTFEVPDVVGMTVKDAWKELNKLRVSVIGGPCAGEDNYIVTSISPPAGTIINTSSSIYFEAEPPKTDVPSSSTVNSQESQ